MTAVFGEKIKELSTESQKTRQDDVVTAFENRLNVLNRASINIPTPIQNKEDKHVIQNLPPYK